MGLFKKEVSYDFAKNDIISNFKKWNSLIPSESKKSFKSQIIKELQKLK